MWPFKKKKEPEPVKTEPVDDLNKRDGKNNYRIYMNIYGKYVAQREVSTMYYGAMLDIYSNTYWTDVEVLEESVLSARRMWDTKEEAVEAARKDAKSRYKLWLAQQNAGVVENLGRLP